MQNINYNPEDINNYIQSVTPRPQYTVPTVDFGAFLQPRQDSKLDTPEEVAARVETIRQQERQNQLQSSTGNLYSQYGINYDLNGDGVVGAFEGMTIGGLLNNIASNVKEAGTGLVWTGTHLPQVGKAISDWGTETYYGAGGGNPLKAAGAGLVSLTDMVLDPYKLGSRDRNRIVGDIIGSYLAGDKQTAKKYAQSGLSEITHRMYEQPFYVGLDVVTPFVGKALQGVTKGGKAATKAQSTIATETAKVAQKAEKMLQAGEKVIKNKSGIPTAELVRAAETGDWTNIPKEAKNVTKEYSDLVSNTMKEYSPSTWREPEEVAIIQKYARDNNVTYQAAERQVKPLLDEMNRVRQEGGVIVTRYTPNKGLANDVRGVVTVEDIPVEMPKAEEILHHDMLMTEQSPEVLAGARKLFTPDEMYSLRRATGREAYDYLKETRKWTEKKLHDNLYEAGIKGIDGEKNLAFNAKKMGSYNPKKDLVTINPKATDGEVLHEWSHKELKDALKAAKNGDTQAIEELGEVRKALGLTEDAVITDKMLEDIADEVKVFIDKGKLPEGALGEYIGKRYGIPEKITKTGVDSGIEHLDRLAAEGDALAQEVSNSAKLFKNGDIFPITHGLAEVDKTTGVDNLGRIIAGRFSTRAFGNAPYEAIAKEIANPNDYINQLTKNYLDEQLKRIIQNGGSADIDIRPAKPEDAMYIPKEAIEDSNKSLSNVLESASKTPLSPDDIAIDKDFLKTFKDQYLYQQTNNPFGRTPMGDLYNLSKSTALASGGYLVGNLQTGLANAVVNSNVGLIDDIINATLTKGKLAKELGLFRRTGIRNTNITPVGKALQEVNLRTGGYLLSKADAKMQNMFAEIATHSKLRKEGIPSAQRVSTLENLEGQKLGEFINDVKLVSLINPTKTILPAGLHGIGGIFNPFWKWVDTAGQSSLYMLKNHPVLANAVLFDILARAGYDKEMQNRLGIGVELDKPFVSYKVNPKTGEPRELSMEYLPQMNTLKFSTEMTDVLRGKGDLDRVATASMPLIGATLMAMKGLNKYGKPMYRDHDSMYDSISIVGGKRYRLNPNTGLPEPLGGQADEVVSALANETLGSLSLINRTLAPTAAWAISKLTGNDYEYYLPYGQSLFGTFGERGKAPTEKIPFLIGGDPTRPRSGEEVGNMLRGIYESKYYPSPKVEQGIYNPMLLRNFYKGLNRRDMKEMQTLMNR